MHAVIVLSDLITKLALPPSRTGASCVAGRPRESKSASRRWLGDDDFKVKRLRQLYSISSSELESESVRGLMPAGGGVIVFIGVIEKKEKKRKKMLLAKKKPR